MAILSRVWGYLVAAAAAVAAVALIFLRGRASGRAVERAEREAEVNEQASTARKEARDVQNQVAATDDDGVADRLKSDWVRRPGSGRR
ncbi:hypothetical protein [Bordetella bronchiseptica]|uniref:hypothetical protein n=1 Tax=Bordetella bronchiseptica TaxID=518 RepID=UPI0005292CFE|nr:hypothetical protein [Bordetella bronchiseptica]